MAYEHKPGTGSIFKNKDKTPGDQRPDYKGYGLDESGAPIEIALWVKDGASGKFFSAKIERKREQQSSGPQTQPETQRKPSAPPNEDLPF